MFQFGILGVSSITPKFVEAARKAGCEVTAIAGRSLDRAQKFAEEYHIRHAYGSYEEMLDHENPDCVYIDTLPVAHYDCVMMSLQHNFPVLCEKAMFTSEQEARTAFDYARQKNLFMMEALWSKFMPASQLIRKWVRDGVVGRPVLCDSMMGWRPERDSRFFDPEIGGGPDYDLTVYAYEMMAWILDRKPEILDVQVQKDPSGVNGTELITLRAGKCLCTVRMSYETANEDGLTILGEQGRIHMPQPNFAEEVSFTSHSGQQEHYVDRVTENGFIYEIQEVVQCIRNKKIASSVQTPEATIACAKLFDAIRDASR